MSELKENKSKTFREVIAYNCFVMTAQKVRNVEKNVAERTL